ncbi:MAG: hypothetical protein JW836_07755 [Deltaproteobacteria bacterium]|nr:hypothetical protein [Deltaproteobacteria bacterium]
MKKKWMWAVIIGVFFCSPARADLSWKALKDFKLEKEPLDVAASVDGQSLFILVPGEIIVYSVTGDEIKKKIPVDKGFDRITYAPGLHALVMTDGGSKKFLILKLQEIHELDLSGLPFKGPENAPVTIVVFTGYE